MSPVRDLDDTLKELLSDPEQAVQYLRAATEESDPMYWPWPFMMR